MVGGLLGTADLVRVSVEESEADGVFLAWLRDCEALLDVPLHLAPVAVAEHLPGLDDRCIGQHMATTNEADAAQPLCKAARSITHSSLISQTRESRRLERYANEGRRISCWDNY
eukprot:scaffold344042_cov34-Prasinocladus_malaysianus.AAC.1